MGIEAVHLRCHWPRLLVGVYDSTRADAEMTDKSAHGNPKKSFGRNMKNWTYVSR